MLTAYLVAQLVPWVAVALVVAVFSIQEKQWTPAATLWVVGSLANAGWTAAMLMR